MNLVARAALVYSAAGALLVGLTATFAPETFFGDFPFIASWVDNLPPYNEHLVTDTGGLYLGFAVLLIWAFWRPSLVVPVCAAFALAQAFHLVFHLRNLDGFSTGDAVTQTASLVGLVAAPLIAIAASRQQSSSQP